MTASAVGILTADRSRRANGIQPSARAPHSFHFSRSSASRRVGAVPSVLDPTACTEQPVRCAS